MERREAIQNLFLLSAGAVLLPSCNFESGPVYANVPLERGQRTLIELLSNAILPREGTEVTTPESTTDYILTVFNDCRSPEQIQEYLTGMKEFELGLREQFNSTFKRLDPEEQVALFSTLRESTQMTDLAKYFFDETDDLTRRHFTGSEYFMTKVLEFEFAPGRYIGCREV